jgi:uncharacterized protein (TIGR00369 family)
MSRREDRSKSPAGSRLPAGSGRLKSIPAGRIPPFNHLIGLRRIRAGAGRAEIRLALKDEHRNRRGVAHGGLLSAMLDAVLGNAVVSAIGADEWCGTAQLSIQFRRPGTGPVLIGRGRLARRGERLAYAEGEVVDAAGEIVAAAHGAWYIWPWRPAVPGAFGASRPSRAAAPGSAVSAPPSRPARSRPARSLRAAGSRPSGRARRAPRSGRRRRSRGPAS